MTATLATTPHSNWQKLAPLWNALGCVPSDDTSPETWNLNTQELPEGNLLLAYTTPQQALETAMESGQAPDNALNEWAESAQALVNLFKANRRRAVLINIQHAATNLTHTAQRLADHWQENIELPELPATEPSPAANPYIQLLANATLQQSPHIKPLLAQLDACTLPLVDNTGPDEGELNPSDLYQALSKETDAENQALSQAREESKLLLEQLHLVQEELEKHVLAAKDSEKHRAETEQNLKKEQTAHTKTKAEKATLENQLKALKTTQKSQAEKIAELEKQLNTQTAKAEQAEKARQAAEQQHQQTQTTLAEENQLLLEQLHLVQEELETKFLQAKERQNTIGNLQTQLQQAQQQQQQAAQQHQQAVHQHAASQKENQLLQARLHKLRDAMENLERTNRTLNGNLAELKNQLAAAKKHQSDWEHKHQQAERNGTLALAAANRRINELSTELNKVTKSRSWRLANPTASYIKKSKKAAAEKLEAQKAEIQNSGLFDETWYQEQYPDVAKAKLSPIEHYLKTGAYEGRNPSETFDTTWYLSYYRDVTESGLNPLIHYIRFGQKEQRAPRPGALASLPAPQAQSAAKQH